MIYMNCLENTMCIVKGICIFIYIFVAVILFLFLFMFEPFVNFLFENKTNTITDIHDPGFTGGMSCVFNPFRHLGCTKCGIE